MDLTDYELMTTKAASAAVGLPAPTMMMMAEEGQQAGADQGENPYAMT